MGSTWLRDPSCICGTGEPSFTWRRLWGNWLMLVGWNKPGHLCARGRSVHASSMSQRRFVVSFGSWNIQSSSYSSAGSRRPYWQPLGSGARGSLKGLEGCHSASLCPLFHCQAHRGAVGCPTQCSHWDLLFAPSQFCLGVSPVTH